jgi:hypothetical protein
MIDRTRKMPSPRPTPTSEEPSTVATASTPHVDAEERDDETAAPVTREGHAERHDRDGNQIDGDHYGGNHGALLGY